MGEVMKKRLSLLLLVLAISAAAAQDAWHEEYGYRIGDTPHFVVVSLSNPVRVGHDAMVLATYWVPQALTFDPQRDAIVSFVSYLIRGVDTTGTLHIRKTTDTSSVDLVLPTEGGRAVLTVPKPGYENTSISFSVRHDGSVFWIQLLDELDHVER